MVAWGMDDKTGKLDSSCRLLLAFIWFWVRISSRAWFLRNLKAYLKDQFSEIFWKFHLLKHNFKFHLWDLGSSLGTIKSQIKLFWSHVVFLNLILEILRQRKKVANGWRLREATAKLENKLTGCKEIPFSLISLF